MSDILLQWSGPGWCKYHLGRLVRACLRAIHPSHLQRDQLTEQMQRRTMNFTKGGTVDKYGTSIAYSVALLAAIVLVIYVVRRFGVVSFVVIVLGAPLFVGNFGGEIANYVMNHPYVLKVAALVVLYSVLVWMVYYIGVLQYFILKLAGLLEDMFGFTTFESKVLASNFLAGPIMATLPMKQLLDHATQSDIQSAMIIRFATVPFCVSAAYIAVGANAEDVVIASVLTLPLARLLLNTVSGRNDGNCDAVGHISNFEEEQHISLHDIIRPTVKTIALTTGSVFILLFVDSVLMNLGPKIGMVQLNVQLLFSYTFTPVAVLFSIPWKDLGEVADVIGSKVLVNDVFALWKLAELSENREIGIAPQITVQSEMMATFALNGFYSLPIIYMFIEQFVVLAPNRSQELYSAAFKALPAAIFIAFATTWTRGVIS